MVADMVGRREPRVARWRLLAGRRAAEEAEGAGMGMTESGVSGNGTGVVWIPDCSRQDGGAEGDLVQNDTFGAEVGLEG